MDDLSVRHLTDTELIAARRGGPLEPYGAQRSGLPLRRGRGGGAANRMRWISSSRMRPSQGASPSSN